MVCNIINALAVHLIWFLIIDLKLRAGCILFSYWNLETFTNFCSEVWMALKIFLLKKETNGVINLCVVRSSCVQRVKTNFFYYYFLSPSTELNPTYHNLSVNNGDTNNRSLLRRLDRTFINNYRFYRLNLSSTITWQVLEKPVSRTTSRALAPVYTNRIGYLLSEFFL